MRTSILLLSLLALGCRPEFASVDEACHDRVPGQASASQQSIDMVHRANCYRRFAQMARGSVDGRIGDAAQAHAEYFALNGLPEGGNILAEDPDLPGFSGQDPVERAVEHGYEVDSYGSTGFWEGVFTDQVTPGVIVDRWMGHHYTRQGVLQPSWLDAGYGAAGEFIVADILYDYPARSHVRRPVLWPRDGQAGVPVGYVDLTNDGIVPFGEPVGYPITATVGSDEAGQLGATNPYGLVLMDSSIEGPDGSVSHHRIGPDDTPYAFPYSVALVPREPLEPDTSYTATFRISWSSRTNVELVTTFTTAAEPMPARPDLLYVVHQPPDGPVERFVPGVPLGR